MLDYTLIAGILLYLLAIRLASANVIKPVAASLVATLGYFAISTVIRGIILHAYKAPLWQLFGLIPIATLFLQIGIALLVFGKMDYREDSLDSWFAWAVAGCVGIFLVAPFVVTTLAQWL